MYKGNYNYHAIAISMLYFFDSFYELFFKLILFVKFKYTTMKSKSEQKMN